MFLCLLAYHVEWHLRRALAPLLYEDDDWAAGEALRDSVVRAAQRSPAAVSKQTRGITADGLRRGQARRARAAAAFSWPSLILSRIRGEAHPRSGPACSPSAAPAPSSPALPTTVRLLAPGYGRDSAKWRAAPCLRPGCRRLSFADLRFCELQNSLSDDQLVCH